MTKDRSNNAGGASPVGAAQRFGRFIRGDLWLVEGDRLLGLVRFRKVIAPNEQREMLAFDDSVEWEQQIRNRWLVGRGGLPGRDGGRLACAQCSKSLQVWEPGKLLGVDCVTRHKPPVDLADCRKISEQRWGGDRLRGWSEASFAQAT